MSIPPIPPPLEHLGTRPFSFYPAILNIEHNEWLFRKATWSEILVHNVKTNEEFWIPRRFLGEISRVEDPVLIVGLVKELEYHRGAVLPHQRRVIEMPVAVGDSRSHPPGASRPEPAPVVGIRLEPGAETRIGRLILGTLMVGVLGTLGVVMVTREGTLRPRINYANLDSAYLDLTVRDDYYSIVRKLGPPAQDHSVAKADVEFRSLWYPQRSYYVILMGSDHNDLHYIGVKDKDWNLVQPVLLPGGASSASMLRGLQKF